MPHVLHWFRRDLRVHDNTALHAAAEAAGNEGTQTGVFIIDPRWWRASEGKLGPHQAAFWLGSLAELRQALCRRNIALVIRTDRDPVAALLALAREIGAECLTFNKEYEPDQLAMDERLERRAREIRLKVRRFKDAAVFEEQEILTGNHGIYSVFTAYKNAWLKRLGSEPPAVLGLPRRMAAMTARASEDIPRAESLGFRAVALEDVPGEEAACRQLEGFIERGLTAYNRNRDFPALSMDPAARGTSRLSAHLNAGTVSIRQVLRAALEARRTRGRQAFLTQLIWRDFYRMVLLNMPHTLQQPFNDKYAHITWGNDPARISAFESGRTGYPMVDAAVAQLRATGFMHNRLRMIAAMFLTKDLDVSWVVGERFFMRTLIDYDQSANVGGWQWSASTGTDAAPYFRIMNPVLQSQRFDPQGTFIRHYVPALGRVPAAHIHAPWKMPMEMQRACGCVIGGDYPAPIVDHAQAREAAIARFRTRRRD